MWPSFHILQSGIAKRFLKFLLVLALTLSALNGVGSYMLARETLERSTWSNLQEVSLEKEAAVKAWMNDQVLGVKAVAEVLADEQTIQEFSENPGKSEMKRQAQDAARDWLLRLQNIYSDKFISILFLNPQSGEVFAASSPLEEGKFKTTRPYFKNGKKGAFIQGPYYSLPRQAPALAISYPVERQERLMGVVVVHLALSELTSIISRSAGGLKTQHSYLINQANLFVTQPAFASDSAILRRANFTPPVRDCLKGESDHQLTTDYRKVLVFKSYRWMETERLCLVTQVDQHEALADSQLVMFQFFGTSSIGIILVMLLAVFYVPSLTKPISDLANAARRIRDGDFRVSLDIDSKDEIGDLAGSFNRMAQKLEHRDALLAREQQALVKARKQAEAGNRAKSDFLANMSHELRTPLNTVIGYSQVMSDEMYGKIDNAKYIEYSRDIRWSGEHLLEVINDILDLSKVEAGKVEIKDENFDLVEVLENSVKLVQGLSSAKDLVLSIKTANATHHLRADKRLITQVIVNLLSNSIKFTPNCGAITMRTQADNTGLQIQIEDTGIGIPADQIAKVLEPFGQVSKSPEITHEGTGLGLPLSKKLIEIHGGSLILESKEGEGTTVSILFPSDRMVSNTVGETG